MLGSLLKTVMDFLSMAAIGLASIAVHQVWVNPPPSANARDAGKVPDTFSDATGPRSDVPGKLAANAERAKEIARRAAEEAKENPAKSVPAGGAVRKRPPAC